MKKIYIPSNLDLTTMLNSSNINLLEKLHYFIHLIYEQRVLYKSSEEYVPLKALYIRRIIREYNECREILVDKGIIACDNQFIKGKKSFGYKLVPPYSEVKHKQVELTNKTMLRNIERWTERRLPQTDVHHHLYKYLKQIEIKYEEAANYISDFDVEEYNPAKIAIDKFLNKDFFLYGDNYGRVHTNITSLKSSLRKFLIYQNQKLVNIDIVNSQPLFLLLLPPFLPIRCTLSREIESSDMCVVKYKHLVEDGTFYDYLMEHLGDKDRQDFKERFFRETFFGRRVSKEFYNLFPSIAQTLLDLKKSDYRSLAWMMQKAESDLIINKICRRIMVEQPKCFVATIHDSILTTPENVTKISEIISEEFSNVGLLPSIRIEQA